MLILVDIAHAVGLRFLGRYVWQQRNYWRAVDRDDRRGRRHWHAEMTHGQ